MKKRTLADLTPEETENLTSYEVWQLEKYGDFLPETESNYAEDDEEDAEEDQNTISHNFGK